MKRFENKVAIVTGAGSGIGRALCLELGQKGCQVLAVDINQEGLNETQILGQKTGINLQIYRLDVSKKEQIFKFKNWVIAEVKQVDILINNAGVMLAGAKFEEITNEDWQWIMDINFWAVLHLCQAFLPILKERPEANITNLSSLYGLMGMPEKAAYSVSKFAVRGLSETMHMELADTSVNVTCVFPGGVNTNIVTNSRTKDIENTKKDAAFFAQKLAKTTPKTAAKIIIRGIQKKQARVLIGKDARNVDRVLRYLPNGRFKLFKKIAPWFKRKS